MLGTIILFAYLFWNVYCFFIMFADKQKAMEGSWRISERKLIGYGFLFGAFGIAFGMMAFSHKTQKADFIFLVSMGILVNIIELCILLMIIY